MSQASGAGAAGQISADGQFRWDGQQWVPLPQGYREPTPWTRPMQLAVAALLVVQALLSVAITVTFINHDSMLRTLQTSNTQLPPGTDINSLADATVIGTYVFIILIALIEIFGGVGSYLGWRWMFWATLVLFGILVLFGLLSLPSLFRNSPSPTPLWSAILSELLSAVNLAVFVWMIIGVARYGPWAMRKPGR
jgi:uncharacterized membrane protein